MRVRVTHLLDALRASFWFTPAVFALLAVAFAVGVPILDYRYDPWLKDNLEQYVMSPSSAQDLLSTIAGAMVTISGVVFSLTLLTLSVASAQMGPRLLRTFMRDRTTHVALGTFVGVSIYSLVVLASVRGAEERGFAPQIAVLLSVLFAVGALVVMIYFIHRVALLIQVPYCIAEVAHELGASIDRLFPDRIGSEDTRGDERLEQETALGDDFHTVDAWGEGYVQGVDVEALVAVAMKRDAVLSLAYRTGHFVTQRSLLARVWPKSAFSAQLERTVNDAFILGNRPTPRQDVECAVNELVEVAVRALSPGINDPFSAINCVDRLAAALARLAQRDVPSTCLRDTGEHVRVLRLVVSFPEVLDAAMNQIRQYGCGSVPVVVRILEGLAVVAAHVRREQDKEAVLRQATMTFELAEASGFHRQDIQDVRLRFVRVKKFLEADAQVQPEERESHIRQ